jgi:hypothetical protein
MYLQTIAIFRSYRIIYYDVPRIFKIEINPLYPLCYTNLRNITPPNDLILKSI